MKIDKLNGKWNSVFLFALGMCFVAGCKKQEDMSSNHISKQLFQADPTIYSEDNTYYLYGTNESNASNGFKVFISNDLAHWESPDGNDDRFALKKGDSFGNGNFWAPQVFLYKGTYYMIYAADEQIAIAKSSSPLGPFTQSEQQPLFGDVPYKTIDPFIFFDDDGQIYIYFVKLDGGNKIIVAKMKDDLSGIEKYSQKSCIKATKAWENTENVSWPVTEGPTVIKKEGIYYLFYSANDFRNPDYAVGYATSLSPMGPWTKQDVPIISRNNLSENGTGHGDIFTGKDNQLYYVFHTHYSNNKVSPRKTAIVELSFEPQKDGPGIFSINVDSFCFTQ